MLFVEDRVLHTGDLFFNHRYPNIDLEAGGSIEQWIGTLDRVLALDGYDRVIPGHGAVTDREGIRQFQSFLRELWEQTTAAARERARVSTETLRSVSLTQDAGYEAIGVPFVLRLDRDFVVTRAWEEATGAVMPRGPAASKRRATAMSVAELFSVAGKVALVTGGSRGIGLMIARGLVEAGAKRLRRVAQGGRRATRRRPSCRSSAPAIALPGDLAIARRHARARRRDRRARAEAPRAREQRGRQLGRAARRLSRGRLGQGDGAQREGRLRPDALAAARSSKPRRRPGDPARVINVGSIDGLQVPLLETYAYSTSKAAVHHLTRVLARKLAPKITVNAIAPGPFESKMMAETLENFGDAHQEELPAGPHRRARRHGRRRDLPRVEGRRLRDGRGDPGGRRHLDDEVGSTMTRRAHPRCRLHGVRSALVFSDVHLGWSICSRHHAEWLARLPEAAGDAELIVLNGDVVDAFRRVQRAASAISCRSSRSSSPAGAPRGAASSTSKGITTPQRARGAAARPGPLAARLRDRATGDARPRAARPPLLGFRDRMGRLRSRRARRARGSRTSSTAASPALHSLYRFGPGWLVSAVGALECFLARRELPARVAPHPRRRRRAVPRPHPLRARAGTDRRRRDLSDGILRVSGTPAQRGPHAALSRRPLRANRLERGVLARVHRRPLTEAAAPTGVAAAGAATASRPRAARPLARRRCSGARDTPSRRRMPATSNASITRQRGNIRHPHARKINDSAVCPLGNASSSFPSNVGDEPANRFAGRPPPSTSAAASVETRGPSAGAAK